MFKVTSYNSLIKNLLLSAAQNYGFWTEVCEKKYLFGNKLVMDKLYLKKIYKYIFHMQIDA